jgi:hypothetical protein
MFSTLRRGIRMRRASCATLLSVTSILLAACGSHLTAPTPDTGLADLAVRYAAAMRSGTGDQLRRWSCGAYAVVYRDITDNTLDLLRRAAARRHGTFGGSTVVRTDQHGDAGEVTLADTYRREGITSLGNRYTFILSKDSGVWKVCDTRPDA